MYVSYNGVLIKKKEKAEVKEVLKLPEGGFVCTQPAGMGVANAEYPEIVAMDCEMVTIETGLALARCSVVDDCGTVIYDKLVLPPTPIVNYNTEFSGITKEQMRKVTTTLEDVQKELLELIPSECVIAGHSLENDLMMLKMCHPNVVDTVQMYPHKRGAPFRNALRFLTERYLRRKIQHEGTHDSVTDARATLELVYLKLIRGETFGNDISENFEDSESLFDHIAKENKTRGGGLENECEVLVFETITNSNKNAETIGVSGATETYKCVSDDDVTMKMQMSMREAPEDMSLLCFGYLRELEDVLEKHALKEKKNAMVLTTSNVTDAIDVAFIDRADVKMYVGNPADAARGHILLSSINELKRVGILPPTKLEMAKDSNLFKDVVIATEGMSGRALRKLPFLTIAGMNRSMCDGPINDEEFLRAVQEQAMNEKRERERLGVNKSV